jgi:dolichol-phosphate mannosyltransferase
MLNKLLSIIRSDLFLYLIVGGLATIVEWSGFWVFFNMLQIQYLLATALAFVFSTFANWAFGRLLVFRGKQNQSLLKELVSIYLTSIGGLLLNLGIMYVMVDHLGFWEMLAKIAATVIVFSYNYLIRKKLIYKK